MKRDILRSKKLRLHKEGIRVLNPSALRRADGGMGFEYPEPWQCTTSVASCPAGGECTDPK